MLHIDLFSGIGGFALAAERVWPNIKHIFCDNEPFAQEVLKKHWPNSQIYRDIREWIEELSWLTVMEYTKRHGLSQEAIEQRCGIALRARDERVGYSEDLQHFSPSNVDGSKKTGSEIPPQTSLWEGKPFLERNESRGQGAEHLRESNNLRTSGEKDSLRNVRGQRSIQGRTEQDTGSSPKLPKTAQSDVVVSEMPSRVAQEQQSDNAIDYIEIMKAIKEIEKI